jgi:acetate kinase
MEIRMTAPPSGQAALLVLNAGSSSLKFAVFAVNGSALAQRYDGQMEGIGAAPHFILRDAAGTRIAERQFSAAEAPKGHEGALGVILGALSPLLDGAAIRAIGHRVVHGGRDLSAPVIITDAIMAKLRGLVPLAPLHQPHNLAGIEAAAQHFPGVPQIACFDTAFHRTQSHAAASFALPPRFFEQGILRYGFHGLSYEYIARRLAAEDAALGCARLIVAHLGNGASLCAIEGGQSRATTMGLTALDGVPMGTRSGQLDPGVVLHMLDSLLMTSADIAHLLYHDSGLKGMSGVSQDVRAIEAAGTKAAEAALDHFAFRVRREIGALAASIGGIDALVFTAGIGENAHGIRARICAGLGFLGINLDPEANAANRPEIGRAGDPVRVLIRHTDEEAMIAEHALALVNVA